MLRHGGKMSQYRNEIRQIMIAINVIEGVCDMIAKKIGMKENTLTLLYALDDGKTHSQKEICNEWLIPKTTLNTIVKECVEAGYIVLNADKDKKEKKICLTEKGQEYVKKSLAKVYEVEERAMERACKAPLEPARMLAQFALNYKEEARCFCDES